METQSIAAVRVDEQTPAASRLMAGHVLLALLMTSGASWVGLIGIVKLAATRLA